AWLRLLGLILAGVIGVGVPLAVRPEMPQRFAEAPLAKSPSPPARLRPQRVLPGHENGVKGLAYSPNGTLLASAGEDKTAKLWDTATGRCIRTIKVDTHCVAFSPNGALLLTGSRTKPTARADHAVRICSVRSGRPVRALHE